MTLLVVNFLLAILIGVFIVKIQEHKNKRWKYSFISLLIVNLAFSYWALVNLNIGSYMWEMGLILAAPLSVALVISDLTALFSYIFRLTHGMTKVLLHAVLLPAILLLIILLVLLNP